ncbi:MAG: sulfatase-like hydrolase/transferase [Myxococcota bacterium]
MVRLFGLVFLVALIPGLVRSLPVVQRFHRIELPLGGAFRLVEELGLWLVASLAAASLLVALARAARRIRRIRGRTGPWRGGQSRLALAALALAAFEIVRLTLEGSLGWEGSGPGRALGEGALALVFFVWVFAAQRVPWSSLASRRPLLRLGDVGWGLGMIWALALLTLYGTAPGIGEAPARVVWIVIDGLRADHVGPGSEHPSLTPALDRFARDSVRFPNAWAQTSWTHTSLGSMLASRHPAAIGWRTRQAVPSGGETIYVAEFLKALGFQTHAILSHPDSAALPGLARSFDRFDASLSLRFGEERLDSQVSVRALRAIESWGVRPSFLLVEFSDPLPPFLADAALAVQMNYEGPLSSGDPLETLRLFGPAMREPDRRYWSAAYREELARSDVALGRILQALRQRPDYARTTVVITSTHGSALLERGRDRFEARQDVFVGSVHVPLWIRLPRAPRGREVQHSVQLTDLLPTLLAHLRAEVPPGYGFAGRVIDLTALEALDRLPPLPVYSETRFGAERWQAVTLGRWSHVRELHSRRNQLYDLERDPAQQIDRAAAEPDRVRQLGRLLDGWLWDTRPEDIWPLAQRLPSRAGGQNLRESPR